MEQRNPRRGLRTRAALGRQVGAGAQGHGPGQCAVFRARQHCKGGVQSPASCALCGRSRNAHSRLAHSRRCHQHEWLKTQKLSLAVESASNGGDQLLWNNLRTSQAEGRVWLWERFPL